MWAIDLSVVVAWQKVFQCLPLSVNDLCSSFLGKHAVLRKDDAAACKRNIKIGNKKKVQANAAIGTPPQNKEKGQATCGPASNYNHHCPESSLEWRV